MIWFLDLSEDNFPTSAHHRRVEKDDAFDLSGKAAWIIGDPKNLKLKLYTVDENLTLTEYGLGF
jgi:hypothetical protein